MCLATYPSRRVFTSQYFRSGMLFILSSTSLVQNSSVYCSPATLPSSLLGNEVHWETGFGLPIGHSGVHSDSLVPSAKDVYTRRIGTVGLWRWRWPYYYNKPARRNGQRRTELWSPPFELKRKPKMSVCELPADKYMYVMRIFCLHCDARASLELARQKNDSFHFVRLWHTFFGSSFSFQAHLW